MFCLPFLLIDIQIKKIIAVLAVSYKLHWKYNEVRLFFANMYFYCAQCKIAH